ncbi:chromate transporter [Mesobacillus maritimus]|uniref:chromate transporter n=1 Tax=Mesobacillus maritimus TaxID=1643336 RepID=UPI00203F59C0|nr:chromate transporter [Mesobacillus maritimus]MCM3584580.1 chromate transporter [Mesobacillus maritimus]MCM3670655.1 chromate transporter [Mesobacillus maritimus]
MLTDLFFTFFIIGLGSFGGGYAILPVIEHESVHHGWMTTQEFTHLVGVAGMAPGPIATNITVLVGFSINGWLGAIVSAVGITLPSFLLVILIYSFLMKFRQKKAVSAAFYGMKPVVTGLIIFASIKFALANGVISIYFTIQYISLVALFILSLFALFKLNWHPALIIVASGMIGAVIYS